MGVIRSVVHPGTTRRRLAALGVFSLMAFYVQLTFAGSAAAAPLTGGFSPTILAADSPTSTGTACATSPTTRPPSTATPTSSTASSTATRGGPLRTMEARATGRSTSQTTAPSSGTTVPRAGSRSTSKTAISRWAMDHCLPSSTQSTEQPRHRRLRFRLVGDRRPGGLERRRGDQVRRLPFRGSRPGGHPRE